MGMYSNSCDASGCEGKEDEGKRGSEGVFKGGVLGGDRE